MPYTSFGMHAHFVMHGKEHLECRHWYWLRRLVGRRGFCRKCQVKFETIARELSDKIDADYMAAMLPKPGTIKYGGGSIAKRLLANIEGS